MKNKKILIIIAAVVLLAAIICAAVFIIKGVNKDEQREGINLVDKFASDGVRSHIVVPQRAAGQGESFDKTEVNPKIYEKFTLTEEESKEMDQLIGGNSWRLASEISFSDVGAKEYWEDVIGSAPFAVSYDPATTYYLLKTQNGFIRAEELAPASSCEIVIYDIEADTFYYIRFDV